MSTTRLKRNEVVIIKIGNGRARVENVTKNDLTPDRYRGRVVDPLDSGMSKDSYVNFTSDDIYQETVEIVA